MNYEIITQSFIIAMSTNSLSLWHLRLVPDNALSMDHNSSAPILPSRASNFARSDNPVTYLLLNSFELEHF